VSLLSSKLSQWNAGKLSIAAGYMLDGLSLIPSGSSRSFSHIQIIEMGSETHPAFHRVGTGDSFPESRHVADHSSPSIPEVKNGETIPPLPYTTSLHDA
jgi:hypothetical protein